MVYEGLRDRETEGRPLSKQTKTMRGGHQGLIVRVSGRWGGSICPNMGKKVVVGWRLGVGRCSGGI